LDEPQYGICRIDLKLLKTVKVITFRHGLIGSPDWLLLAARLADHGYAL